MAEYPCKVWSGDRCQKKTFMALPSIKAVIYEANSLDIPGWKFVLECDGTEICTDAVLEFYLKTNSILMLLGDDEWKERQTPSEAVAKVLSTENITLPNASDTMVSSAMPEERIQYIVLNENATESNNFDSYISFESSTSASEPNSPLQSSLLNFKIPWEKLPTDIMDILKSGNKLGKRLNVMANIIVDEMRLYSHYIPMSALRAVTQQAIANYPDSFLEKDSEGVALSTSTVPLLTVLRNRNNFLNRAPNRVSNALDPIIPAKHRRRTNLMRATCTNWQPMEFSSTDSFSSTKSKQEYLKSLYGTQETDAEKEIILNYMKDCFPLQRVFFNKMDPVPTIIEIKREWPYIFQREYLGQHFSALMKVDSSAFSKNFKEKKPQLLKCLEPPKNRPLPFSGTDELAIVTGIAAYFTEDIKYLLQNFEFGTPMEALRQKIPTNTPFIASIKAEMDVNDVVTYIFIEKEVVANYEGNVEVLDVIADVINYYYIFNIMYPRQISQTMEFLVRFGYKIYNEKTRGSKKNINSLQKINNFLSKINSFVC